MNDLMSRMTWTLGVPRSRRAVIKGGVAGAAAGAFGALGLRASSQEATAVLAQESTPSPGDLLPSWNDGAAREQLLAFIDSVTDESNDAFVEPADRIAAFDNDGTLWCEMPYIPQYHFVLGYIRTQAELHPELRTMQPYKAVWEHEGGYLEAAVEGLYAGDFEAVTEFLETVMAPFAGMSPADYETLVQEFFDSSLHPDFRVPYRNVTYQPMVELVRLLQANQFDVFIVTGGGRDFVRVISEDFYGIPRANVIGSSVEMTYQIDEAGGTLVRTATMDWPFDDGPGKPVRIEMQVGRQPILVGGNSDGDVPMLAYAQAQHPSFLGLLVNHDDAEREYAYTTGAEHALAYAESQGWIIASMKDDFAAVFPPAS